MITTIAVLLFVGVDIAIVIAALLWLSQRRSQDDDADVRYVRQRMRRRRSLK
jgi:hypothetical protein